VRFSTGKEGGDPAPPGRSAPVGRLRGDWERYWVPLRPQAPGETDAVAIYLPEI